MGCVVVVVGYRIVFVVAAEHPESVIGRLGLGASAPAAPAEEVVVVVIAAEHRTPGLLLGGGCGEDVVVLVEPHVVVGLATELKSFME